MTALRSASLAFVATLALAACNSKETATEGEIAEAQPVAAVPAPAGQAWSDVAAVTPEGGIVQGNPNAPIKLVEYASHTCSHCAEFSEQSAEPLRPPARILPRWSARARSRRSSPPSRPSGA